MRVGDDSDWLGNVQRRNWLCPNGDSTGFISYVAPDNTLDTVKALAGTQLLDGHMLNVG